MPAKDKRIDAYIAKAPLYAKPILTEVRARVHKALPSVEETIKWNVPFFLCEGKILASMPAFESVHSEGEGDCEARFRLRKTEEAGQGRPKENQHPA